MDSNTLGTTYLLHFEKPLKHARHYLGWTNDFEKRMEEHHNGKRERCVLTWAIRKQGIIWTVARTRVNVPISHEKKIKKMKNSPRYCPICNGEENES